MKNIFYMNGICLQAVKKNIFIFVYLLGIKLLHGAGNDY